MAMSFKHSFKESGSDEARDTEDDTEVCSHCATDEKLQRALYFCYNCGVFGRYICGKCLTHHNRIVKSHRVEMISNQSMTRGQTLETELETERNNVEELRHKLDDSMKQIEKYLEERDKLETELEAEKKTLNEQFRKLDDRKNQIEKLENADREMNEKNKLLEDKSEQLSKSLEQEKKMRNNVENDLKSARDSASRLEGQLNGVFDEYQKHQKIITELEAKCKNLETTCKDLNKQKYHMEQLTNKNMEHMQSILKEEKRKSDDEYKKLLAERDDLRDSLEQEKKMRNNVESDLKSGRDSASRLEGQLNGVFVENQKHRKIITELEAKCKTLETTCKDLNKQKYHMEQQANKNMDHMQSILKEEKRKSDDEYKKLLAERDDLRDRFSKLAGKKLQEQNADIADLSDPNRAMKVSEKFGQLYDDDWTNAFECLTDKKIGVPLKDAINVLLRLLQECWTFCNQLLAAQMESLKYVFLHPARNVANFDQRKYGPTDRPRITSKDQPSLNDLRKRVGEQPPVIEEVKKALLADSKTWDKREKKEFNKKHIEACTPYIQKCAEVCWLVALHDPPLLMKMDVKQGEKFDSNIYTVYRQSGQTIDILVWPPLYNGRDGGLLSKGVAEPIRVVGKKK